VAVVGAGTAGSAAALMLTRAGHRVSMFEAVADPEPIGAGIMLQPIGMVVLDRLGLLDPILAHGHPVRRLRCVSGGRRLFDLPYSDRDPSAFGLGLHRGALFATLFEAVRREVAEVHCGARVDQITPDGFVDFGRDRAGPFDLVIAADGAGSALRARHRPDARDTRYPWGALWFVAEDPERLYRDELLQHVRGARKMVGLLPTGRSWNGDTTLVSLFVSVRRDRAEAVRSDLSSLKRDIAAVAPPATAILEQLQSSDQLLFAEYRHVTLREPARDRLVFLGDAGHAMSPQLGQGANLALWDAMTLADALADSFDDGLRTWSVNRRPHIRYYQFMTRWLTPFFQSDSRLAGWFRDAFMPLACALPVVRRQMVATMCGVKRGIVRRSMPLEMPRRTLKPADD
jgi:2-polyprenyl-6-methoxyphenol hydroxylase-like FAD-dependent oxidoreductase